MTDDNTPTDSVEQPDTGNAAASPESDIVEAGPGTAADRSGSNRDTNLEALLRVPVALSIEVGRKKMRLDDLIDTQEGSVIELDKLLNEPLDILVNGALIAHGVIVLAQDRFGIQITDILSPEERARTL
jgi:flagellar motor switch protein FliN/FliY